MRPAILALPLNLWAGIRLAPFLPASLREFRQSTARIIAAAALGIALIALYDYARAAPQHHFSLYGVTYLATDCC